MVVAPAYGTAGWSVVFGTRHIVDIDQLETTDSRVGVLAWPFAKGANYMQFGVNASFSFATLVFMRVTGSTAALVEVQDVPDAAAQELVRLIFGAEQSAPARRAITLNWCGRVIELLADRVDGADFTLVHLATNGLAAEATPKCNAGWLSVRTDRHGTGESRWEMIRPGLQKNAEPATAA